MFSSLLSRAVLRTSTILQPALTRSFGAVVRNKAPAFNTGALLPNGTFGTLSLDQYKGKWVVFFWYPADFTFVCPTEIIAFSDRAADFRKINCEVIGASVDSNFVHLAWTQTDRKKGGLGKMQIPLLADVTKQVSKDYGCLVETPGDDLEGMTVRATYIIDPKGIVRHIGINDAPVGRSVDETLRLVQAFQYTDTHGEVCPAGWKPGSKTMIADPVKSQDYFKTVN